MRRELSDIIAMVEAGQLDLALQAAQEIEDERFRSLALRDIAEAMAKVGQFDRALQIAQKIESAKIESALVRFLALAGIAAAMAEAGQTERANQVFQLARQVVQKIEVASACFEGLGGHRQNGGSGAI
jgi:serine protease Do